MRKIYTPAKKYKGSPKAFDLLKESIAQAVDNDERMQFEYKEEKLNLQIAAVVHKLRMDAGLTQKQLAEKVGLSQPFVARLENPAAPKKPKLETLAKIASAFNKQVIIDIV